MLVLQQKLAKSLKNDLWKVENIDLLHKAVIMEGELKLPAPLLLVRLLYE